MSTAGRVIHYIDSEACGGVEQVLLTLLVGQRSSGWDPLLIHHPAPGLSPLLDQLRDLAIGAVAVPRPEGSHALLRTLGLGRLLRRERAALFHAHLNWPLSCRFGLAAAIMARVPVVVVTEHLFRPVPWRRSIAVQRLLATGVDRYVAVSHDLGGRLRRELGLPAQKILVIHNGIPPCRFDQPFPSRQAAHDAETSGPLVLAVARLSEQKGLEFLLEAVALLPGVSVTIAGDGPLRPALTAQARALGLGQRVRFLGHRTDVAALLEACDCFVLPSLFEGLALSVLEAMAAGRPVIATAVGGTPEAIVDGESGLLVPPGDPVALANALRAVLTNPALAQRLAAGGQARVRREFAAEVMVDRVDQLYRALLRQVGGPR